MPDRFYSVLLGEQNVDQVTEGASTSAEAVELRVSDTIYASKAEVILGVQAILQYLIAKETQPIA